MTALLVVMMFALLTVAGAGTAGWLVYDGVSRVWRKRVEPEHEIGA